MRATVLVAVTLLLLSAFGADDAATVSTPGRPAWVALWQDAYTEMADPGFDPERVSTNVAVDRTTGDAYLSMWNYGVWKSSDGGRKFARSDGGNISGGGCGPICDCSFYGSPNGGKFATFNMNNHPGASGCSLDGGKTWQPFESVGRNWDFGAIDFESKTIIAARHEDEGVHVSQDCGKTWTQLSRQRSGITGLAVVGKVLLIGTKDAIERSEDDGKTWTKIADTGAVGAAVSFKDKLWWLCTTGRTGVLVSDDLGRTWKIQGEPLPLYATLGPFFGKDQNHIVVAGNSGFYETLDGCKTWKLAAALPKALIADGRVQSAAFDRIHDTFYLTSASRPVMKYARSAAPDYATRTVPDDEKLTLADAARPKVRCVVPCGADISSDFLFLGGEDGIISFKREQTGKIPFLQQALEERSGGCMLRCAGGRIYGVTEHDGYRRMKWHGLAWFDIDPQTGKPTRKGVVECPASRQMIVGPGGKDLYLKACGGKEDKIFWFSIADDGKPVRSGEVSGKGIGASRHSDYPGIVIMAPDAKQLYAVSADDYAIACIDRKPSGELVYHGATDLEPVVKRDPKNALYLWLSLAISSDGKYVYASVRNGNPNSNFYAIFKRDAGTGELSFSEKFSGEQDPLANLKGWNMVAAPTEQSGFLGSFSSALATFKYDAQTGHLSDAAFVKETVNNGTSLLMLDANAHFLYVGGREMGYDQFFSFKVK